jgi:hypothetical protein
MRRETLLAPLTGVRAPMGLGRVLLGQMGVLNSILFSEELEIKYQNRTPLP